MHISKKFFTSENIKLIFSLVWAVKNFRSGTSFFLIYINGQREATQILQDLQDLHLFYRKNKKERKFKCLSWIWLFISSREVKKCIFHSCLRYSWNIHFFTSLDEIKVIFTPNIWISSISSLIFCSINHPRWSSLLSHTARKQSNQEILFVRMYFLSVFK